MQTNLISKRRIFGWLVALALVATASTASAAGELSKQRNLFELGIYAGAMFPSDTHELYEDSSVAFQRFKKASFDIGGRLAYLPLPWLGLEIEGGVMPTKTDPADESALLYTFRGHLLLQIPTRVTPFILGGGGLLGVSSGTSAVGDNVDPAGHWGLGLKWYVNRHIALRAEGRHIIGDGLGNDTVAQHWEVLGGLSVVLGWKPAPKDTDGDGLTDDKDACPKKAAATPDGCPPPDRDADGVPDDQDQCPEKPAKTSNGCPDADGDGVSDGEDKCPHIAAQTPNGCPPDADGDGVADAGDKCPNTPGTIEAEGCPPDGDKDGIVDANDNCPEQPETKNGFEDSDGCPDELPKAVQRYTGSIKGITFAMGKAAIRPSSYRTLNRAAKVLEQYPDLRIMIRGHTDSTGSRGRNLELSAERAGAVKTYLVSQGIADDRVVTEGVGPEEPVAPNNTRAGRAANRRIEFKLITE